MDDDWETAAEKEVVIRPKVNVNKWDGEDDDDDVKESWEDEEEKKDEEKSETKTTVPAKPKPNKALKAKLAEQERIAEEEEAERLANMSPEEKLAEKLRLQKIQEEADLNSALDTFGVNTNLNEFNPETKEEFKEYAETVSWSMTKHKESPFYEQLVEDVVRNICAQMSSGDIKKVKICVESLHSEKLKLEKQTKKPAGKGKGRATIRTENDDIETYKNYGDDFGGDEYDDFM